ncbi:hypothetical protein C173_31119 [Paenibacillus sp. FSL R7-277]|uniref:hypothetical protein n=1 Tax=Paenibacillus sp. FSL R7-277 TaxID=1227352 RepID=UPI0003E1BF6A|nr:hypothetical protein [Paenibacillus sp. FSL R7-277]ETT58464.1 hypothetical protein C173_31119 [Paenibacillus sp. FSL R7-277]
MYPRSAKRRKRKTRKLGLRILQSGMAVSVLLMYTSGQIGSTYGEFNTSQEQISSIGLCSVFPGQIEQLLSEFSGHLNTVIELKASLGSHSISGVYNTSVAAGELSLAELDQAADELSSELTQAGSEIDLLEKQLSFNGMVWQHILQEIGNAAAILHKLGGYMENLDPNCLEIRDAQFFDQIQESLHQSGILSESLAETLSGIVQYLGSIHDIGGSLPTGNPDRVLLRQDDYSFPAEEPILSFVTSAYQADSQVSPALLATYEQLNTELTASKDTLFSTIHTLQERLTEIAEAKTTLEDKAKAQQEEEERLALEKADKARAEEAQRLAIEKQKAADEALKLEHEQAQNQPAATSLPDKSQPGEEPAPAAPVEDNPVPTASAAAEVIPTATPATEIVLPEATPDPLPGSVIPGTVMDGAQPAPTATPAPQSEPSKGGE